jgi:cell division protein FtsL
MPNALKIYFKNLSLKKKLIITIIIVFIVVLTLSLLFVESQLLFNISHMMEGSDHINNSTQIFKPTKIEKIPCADLLTTLKEITSKDSVTESIK